MNNTAHFKAKAFIERELADLAVSRTCQAYPIILGDALAAAEVLSEKDLKTYIEESIDTYPNSYLRG